MFSHLLSEIESRSLLIKGMAQQLLGHLMRHQPKFTILRINVSMYLVKLIKQMFEMLNYRQFNTKTKNLTNQGKPNCTNWYKTFNNSSLSTNGDTFAYMMKKI